MTWNAQRDTESRVEQTLLGSQSSNEFLPKLFKGLRSMVSVKVNGLSVAFLASCVAFLAGVIITSEYSFAPSDVWLGLSQYLVLFGHPSSPVGSIFACALLGASGLLLSKLLHPGVMARQEFRDTCLGVHCDGNGDNATTSTLAKVLSLILRNPLVNAFVVGSAMVAVIGKIFNVPCHIGKFNGIKFNEGLQAKRVNCWNPDRQANNLPRAISSQAASTLAEGSSTTGEV